jgi:small-conductance mechanosensitive channel
MWPLIQNLSLFLISAGLHTSDLMLLSVLVFVIVLAGLYFAKCLAILILTLLERQFCNGQFALWLNVIEKVRAPIIVFNGLYYGSIFLPLPSQILEAETYIYMIVSVFFFIIILRTTIVDFVKVYFQAKGTSEQAVKTVTNFTKVTSTIILGIVAVLIILQFSQLDTQALLGGLGVASIIVAFSFQNILRDVFAFFSIYVDRSFSVGDYITFDKIEGTIKEIRMRTTKIQALKGNEIIVSNNQIVNGIINNYRSMKKRRVPIKFHVCPNTSAKASEAVGKGIKEIFAAPDISQRIELSNVTVNEFTDFGIEYYIIYRFIYIPGDANFYQHLAYKEKILLRIKKLLEKHKVALIQSPYSAGCSS